MDHFELDRPISRRTLLAGSAAGAALLALHRTAGAAADPWTQAQSIITRLANPVIFPAQNFYVTAYGATQCGLIQQTQYNTSTTTILANRNDPSNSPDCYPAFKAAIQACNAAGGGHVIVPKGNWYCAGPIVLLSNVDFHLQSGAVIWFSPNPADYAKYGPYNCGTNGNLVQSRWQGNDCYNYCSPVCAYGQNNIALTADDNTCILNGQAGTSYGPPVAPNTFACWWTFKGSSGTAGWVSPSPGESTVNPLNQPLLSVNPSLNQSLVNLIQNGAVSGGTPSTKYLSDGTYLTALSEASIPLSSPARIMGIGHQLPPCMIEFFNCTNVLMQNYQVTNTPFWQHHPIACRNVVIRGVYVNSTGPNNDGFDPEACSYVLVDGVSFNTGDDCIAIKSGKDNDIEFGPSQNIVIQNCTMQSGHGGVTMGSELTAGIQNVFIQNCTFQNQFWATNSLQIGIRIKMNMNRGGFLNNLYIRNITIPNGIQTTASFLSPLSGSSIPKNTVSDGGGGLITFDGDYSPSSDNARIRVPVISNINISNVTVTAPPGKTATCYQAIVALGPVATDYNGAGVPGLPSSVTATPITNVTISSCNFGTPAASTPYYINNIKNLVLSNVVIGATTYNTTLNA